MHRKVIVITGTSNGIGKLAALDLARRGYSVYATMRDVDGRNRPVREELLAAARSGSDDLHVVEMDVTDERSVQAAIDTIMGQAGRIDALINNAGSMPVGVTEAYSLDQVQDLFDVNFFGAVRTDRAVLPYMRQAKSGLIIHVTSLAGRAVFPFFGVYCASKFAVEALAEAYQYELAGTGVQSVIVEPGPYPSNLLSSSPVAQDQSRLSGYGDAAALPEQLKAVFNQIYNSPNPPRTQQVIDAFIKLIEMDGRRPLRSVVMPDGMDFGIERMNQAITPLQNDLLGALGLSAMI